MVVEIMVPSWMPYYNRDPQRDRNFDNHPYKDVHGLGPWIATIYLPLTSTEAPTGSVKTAVLVKGLPLLFYTMPASA